MNSFSFECRHDDWAYQTGWTFEDVASTFARYTMPKPARSAELNTATTKHAWNMAAFVASLPALCTLANHFLTRSTLEHLATVSHTL